MRRCRFCDRWFKNKQAVRRHLGYCKDYLNAEHREVPWRRERLFQCDWCRHYQGTESTPVVTVEETHQIVATYGGCPSCGRNAWVRVGWKRVHLAE